MIDWFTIYFAIGWIIRVAMVPVVLRRQFTPGASLAWLGIVAAHPYIGLGLYLLVGESRLGRGRAALYRELADRYRNIGGEAFGQCVKPGPAWEAVALQAQKVGRLPVVGGNDVEFIGDSVKMVERLAQDISAAASQVHLLYYMLADDETGRRVEEALYGAVKRGVACRVLADAFASRKMFHGDNGLANRLKRGGVQVAAALPNSLLRRRDLRNHRKLAAIDGQIGYVGSQNLINADYGGRKGGPWVDLTGRFTGPIVAEIATLFAEDWAFETSERLPVPTAADIAPNPANIAMQAVPTGPALFSESYRRVLLGAIQSATRQIVITTPYFVPDDPTLVSLMMAADRGVKVTLILPENPDHFFAAAAGRAHCSSLLDAGIAIHLYRPGLIHTKSATIDDSISLFGSANLDPRSFHLNFEISILAYGPEVTQRLRNLQLDYLKDARAVNVADWHARPAIAHLADSAVALLSPLL